MKKKLLLDRYIQLLSAGDVVAFPTETVYGLGADAWNLSAVQKVYETKGRPSDNPLIVHITSFDMLQQFAAEIPKQASSLMDAFWPGPLTLIFKKEPNVLDAVTAGLNTVAIRWPSHPMAQQLISKTGPLVAPSANSSGRPSPTRPQHVKEDFGDDFPVIEDGETDIGLESTVLDVSSHPFRIYRPGAVSAQQIEGIVQKQVKMGGNNDNRQAARSPGTKYSHYSPKATVKWLDEEGNFDSENTLYLLHTLNPPLAERELRSRTTSTTAGAKLPFNWENRDKNIICFDQDYKKMAHQLFDRFRQADHQGYREIRIEPFTEKQMQEVPIIPALKNRISKAVG